MRTPCQVINRVEAAEPDSHGNPVYEDADPIPSRCFVSARAGSEFQDGRAVEQGWTLLLPADMAGRINAFAYIDVEGYGLMECDGEPAVLQSLATHAVHHVEVTARRTTT